MPSSPGRRERKYADPMSVKRPMPHSGIANIDLHRTGHLQCDPGQCGLEEKQKLMGYYIGTLSEHDAHRALDCAATCIDGSR